MTHQLRSCKLNFALTSCSNEKGKNASILKLHFTTGLTVSTSSLTDKLGKLLKRRKRTVHLGAKATSKPQKNKQIKKNRELEMQLEAGKKTGETTLLCQTRKNTFYLRFFTKFWKQFSSNMASGWSEEFPGSSDEEDFFARSTVEEISQMKQDRQRISKNHFAMWMKRLTLSSTNNLRKVQVIPMLRFLLMMVEKKTAKVAWGNC